MKRIFLLTPISIGLLLTTEHYYLNAAYAWLGRVNKDKIRGRTYLNIKFFNGLKQKLETKWCEV